MMNPSGNIRPTLWFVSALGAALPAAATSPAAAQEIGDAAEGHHLAEMWCASCQVVAPDSPSATKPGAPTFAASAQMKSVTPMSLHVFLHTPHERMPDLQLNRGEIDDLTSYILSLREK